MLTSQFNAFFISSLLSSLVVANNKKGSVVAAITTYTHDEYCSAATRTTDEFSNIQQGLLLDEGSSSSSMQPPTFVNMEGNRTLQGPSLGSDEEAALWDERTLDVFDLFFHLKCHEAYEDMGGIPIHTNEDWLTFRQAYIATVGQDKSTIAPDILNEDGFAVKYYVDYDTEKGRALFAAEDIPKGTFQAGET